MVALISKYEEEICKLSLFIFSLRPLIKIGLACLLELSSWVLNESISNIERFIYPVDKDWKISIPKVILGIESISNWFELKTLISLSEKFGANNELFELIDLILNEYSGTKKVSSIFVAKTGLNTNKE